MVDANGSQVQAEVAKEKLDDLLSHVDKLRQSIKQVIVGQGEVVDGVITCMLARSHVLLEGVPGLGKTMLVRTLSEAVDLPFSRIQFTPDLMPADIIGTTVVEENTSGGQRFEFKPGPIFAPLVLADEINRATPKTQSALLEAMQEHRVTVGGTTHELGQPYFVLATQNPLEMEGTYPLPEAQLDRFFFKLKVPFPSRAELHEIMNRTTFSSTARAERVLSAEDVVRLSRTVREVPVAGHVQDYVVRLLRATHPNLEGATDMVKRYVGTGGSPRGAQAMLLASKIRALMAGRIAASIDDVRAVAGPALRHRILLNFEGEAESITTDAVIAELLEQLAEAAN
jgi:MoxR-like ATPase